MGTHSLIYMREIVNGKTLTYAVLYQQYDGYVEGVGKNLVDFLKNIKIVNGFVHGVKNQANGAGCLFAQLIKHFKDDVGGSYLVPITDTEEREQFNYYVDVVDKNIMITIYDRNNFLFEGSVEECVKYIKSE